MFSFTSHQKQKVLVVGSCLPRTSECGNISLFGNRVFADVITDVILDLFRVRVGPRSNNWCVYKRKEKDLDTERDTDTEGPDRQPHKGECQVKT